MTLRQNEHEFLEISYPELGFLVNRNQFTTSIFIEKEINVKSKVKYIDRIINYNESRLICFNLDFFLKDLFRFGSDDKALLALVLDADIFYSGHRELFKRLVSSAKIILSDEKIALKIGNEARINNVKLSEIKLFSNKIYENLIRHGVLGIRFIAGESIQYFIDIEKLIFNTIIYSYRKHA